MAVASRQPHVAVIGAGPAGLMAAEAAATRGARVTVHDRMAAPGRKFLLAGRGGLNLTHSEDFEILLARYGAARERLRAALEAFPPTALRRWSEELGQPTFVGTSGRVFPSAFKASPLLRAWRRRLDAQGVVLRGREFWRGFDDGALLFEGPQGAARVAVDAVVLALGGASWPRLGSDGGWLAPLREAGIETRPLRPANCGFLVDWSAHFRDLFEGEPLKGVAVMFEGAAARGDVVVTRAGLEGGALYALSAPLREAVAANGFAMLEIALKPDAAQEELTRRIASRDRKQSFGAFARKSLRLSPVAAGLLQEAARRQGGAPLGERDAAYLARLVNAVPVRLSGAAPLERAISTAGGVAFEEVDDAFMLRKLPGVFVAGEMLDWEAPTGGYLLQACFATGAVAGRAAAAWAGAAARG
ncbi:TIGR03862 family flavoprotein [Methylocella sp.]|uniref:TIGR03862 family flavoprotein n=1 Tax=Methylocella sp. TaxID=1978226 RepID=UPI003784E079